VCGRLARQTGARLRAAAINGQPGALALDPDGRIVGAICLDIADGKVQAVRSVVNPDKLRHLGPVGDLAGLLRDRGAAGRGGG
jgi:RNA polymerase sigma-70 factor (ECF subfamily)